MSDWRVPVKPFFMPAGNVTFVDEADDGDRQSLVMGFHPGDPAVELYLRGEVCNNCAMRLPAEPNKQNLRFFEPISDSNWPYPDEAVRSLIRNRQCPACRAPVSAEINARLLVSDRWSEKAVGRERDNHFAALAEDDAERAKHAEKKAGA